MNSTDDHSSLPMTEIRTLHSRRIPTPHISRATLFALIITALFVASRATSLCPDTDRTTHARAAPAAISASHSNSRRRATPGANATSAHDSARRLHQNLVRLRPANLPRRKIDRLRPLAHQSRTGSRRPRPPDHRHRLRRAARPHARSQRRRLSALVARGRSARVRGDRHRRERSKAPTFRAPDDRRRSASPHRRARRHRAIRMEPERPAHRLRHLRRTRKQKRNREAQRRIRDRRQRLPGDRSARRRRISGSSAPRAASRAASLLARGASRKARRQVRPRLRSIGRPTENPSSSRARSIRNLATPTRPRCKFSMSNPAPLAASPRAKNSRASASFRPTAQRSPTGIRAIPIPTTKSKSCRANSGFGRLAGRRHRRHDRDRSQYRRASSGCPTATRSSSAATTPRKPRCGCNRSRANAQREETQSRRHQPRVGVLGRRLRRPQRRNRVHRLDARRSRRSSTTWHRPTTRRAASPISTPTSPRSSSAKPKKSSGKVPTISPKTAC